MQSIYLVPLCSLCPLWFKHLSVIFSSALDNSQIRLKYELMKKKGKKLGRREFLKYLSVTPILGLAPVRKTKGQTLKKNLFKKKLFENSPAG